MHARLLQAATCDFQAINSIEHLHSPQIPHALLVRTQAIRVSNFLASTVNPET